MTARALLEADQLMPCPFCGNTSLSIQPPSCRRDSPYNPADSAFPSVFCNCGAFMAGTNWDQSCKSAIAAWNRRIASSLEGQADGEGIPEGYDVAGNFGNGKWYFTKDDHPQAYLGEGWDTRQGAIAAAIDAARTAQSKDKPA